MIPIWCDGPLTTVPVGGALAVWSASTLAPAGIKPRADDLRDAAGSGDGGARLARRLLARAMVSRVAEVAADTVRIGRTPAGSPMVEVPAGWHVALSGREDRALIAVARRPVAVDREPVDEAPVLWDMLTSAEAASIRTMPRDAQPSAWLLRWTVKEAHAKLVGTPRLIRPEQIETTVGHNGRVGARHSGQSKGCTRTHLGAIETVLWWAVDTTAA